MYNSLPRVIQVVELDPEFLAIRSQRIHLFSGNLVSDGQTSIRRRHVVVRSCHRPSRLSNFATRQTQALEGLRTGHFMNQMQIDINDGLLSGLLMDHMVVPDFFKERLWIRACHACP